MSGDLAGRALPYLAEPKLMPLSQWRAAHPQTEVLIGDGEE